MMQILLKLGLKEYSGLAGMISLQNTRYLASTVFVLNVVSKCFPPGERKKGKHHTTTFKQTAGTRLQGSRFDSWLCQYLKDLFFQCLLSLPLYKVQGFHGSLKVFIFIFPDLRP